MKLVEGPSLSILVCKAHPSMPLWGECVLEGGSHVLSEVARMYIYATSQVLHNSVGHQPQLKEFTKEHNKMLVYFKT